jgi:hypothetical protein
LFFASVWRIPTLTHSFRYHIFGLNFESDIEFSGLSMATGATDVVIRRASLPRPRQYSATRTEQFIFAPNLSFCIRDGREIQIDPGNAASSGQVRVFLLGRVMAFLLRQRGWLPLHASGVAIDGKAVLFVAPSGAGKSTTAAAFHLRGHRVITDDVGAIRSSGETAVVQPGGARLRLLQDSAELLRHQAQESEFELDKHSYDFSGRGEPSGLICASRIYVLENGPDPGISSLGSVLATALMNRHSFIRHRRSEPDLLTEQFRQCAEIAELVPVKRLIRPNSLARLPELVAQVEADLAQ